MKIATLCVAMVLTGSSAVFAQTTTTPQPTTTGTTVPGANSFTEAQARDRIAQAGYSAITGLTKADDGVWRGKATKDGAMVDVAIDYKGTVSSH